MAVCGWTPRVRDGAGPPNPTGSLARIVEGR
jgi:hypothetical protein